MTDKQTLLDLAKWCEEAGEPSRDLDCDIYAALDNRPAEFSDLHEAPDYTASLDAAMTLVPEGLFWTVDNSPSAHIISLGPQGEKQLRAVSDAETPALALTATALRALAAMEP